ncbi:hypothetical protein Rsub_00181 [Raphidocelis subcapitata]|uniref:Serine aminopeptidase S33 domain-containing protein n=1 Tax=Raphidocelis subcapitata TaxID=307507 RepID=A0A2V0NPP6_9CHLO|nr:hypothetical protein Rsub_00181 [Raphidocelis subcapitata]|eukprot:GBF87470.1 hypothetical protein Rsub_00181 [Raphidocelis subcapitata]
MSPVDIEPAPQAGAGQSRCKALPACGAAQEALALNQEPAVSFFTPAGEPRRIAYVRAEAALPAGRAAQRPLRRLGLLFCNGLATPMAGPKSVALEAFAREHLPSVSSVRFDYSAHTGLSSGSFSDSGNLRRWVDDALAVLDGVTDPEEQQIVVGSSMGGLVALHLALLRPRRVAALVLLAPALGFAERRWARLSDDQRAALLAGGRLSLNTEAAPRDAVGADFYRTAREFDLPAGPGGIPIRCPVRILHGLLDATVPLSVSQGLVTQIAGDDVALQLVKGGEHKLTSPRDLVLLQSTVAGLVLQLQQEHGGCDGAAGAAAAAVAALEP